MVLIVLAAFAVFFAAGGDRVFQRNMAFLPEYGEIIVHFIDVGQGDSTLIHTVGHAVLIDAGEPRYGRQVVQYLRSLGITHLDYVVATHPHSDHIGGLIQVLADKEIGTLLMPDAVNNTNAFENLLAAIENHNIHVRIPEIGDRVQAGIIDMVVLAPVAGHWPHTSNLNNASIVLHMTHGNNSFLFTGDAERESEMAMIASGNRLHSTILQVGHHGSRTSTTQEFLNAVNPVAAVISLGEGNRHGHPHREVIDRLEAAGVTILRTDEMGTIIMSTTGDGVRLWD